MPVREVALSSVLESIKGTAPLVIHDYQNKGEWFLVKSKILPEQELFGRLERNWRAVVGEQADRFALLLVATGPQRGVWVHYFATPEIAKEYLPGCHRLPSWF